MAVQYYYDSNGRYIAFRRDTKDRFLFDSKGNWFGWLAWNDDDFADIDGKYLGTIMGDRLYRTDRKKDRKAGVSGDPGRVSNVLHPGRTSYMSPPYAHEDIVIKKRLSPNRLIVSGKRKDLPPPPTAWERFMKFIGFASA